MPTYKLGPASGEDLGLLPHLLAGLDVLGGLPAEHEEDNGDADEEADQSEGGASV